MGGRIPPANFSGSTPGDAEVSYCGLIHNNNIQKHLSLLCIIDTHKCKHTRVAKMFTWIQNGFHFFTRCGICVWNPIISNNCLGRTFFISSCNNSQSSSPPRLHLQHIPLCQPGILWLEVSKKPSMRFDKFPQSFKFGQK